MTILTVNVTNVTLQMETSGDLVLTVSGANDQYMFTISDRRDQGVIFRSKVYARKRTCLAAGRKKLRAAVRLLEEAKAR